jgi:hypothetical protein
MPTLQPAVDPASRDVRAIDALDRPPVSEEARQSG